MRRFRLLPLLVLVALLVFAVRFGETMTSVKNFNAEAVAEEKKPTEQPAENTLEKEAVKPAEKPVVSDIKTPEMPAPDAATEEKPALTLPEVWSSTTDEALQTSPARENLLMDLTKRRNDLDKREEGLRQREAMLSAAQKQMDVKMSDMAKLKADLEALLGQQSEADMTQTKSLVKIYEGMKPKDAAGIFDQLDIDLLLQIAGSMSSLRLSPIIAAMQPEKAGELTMRLATLKKIPDGVTTPTGIPQPQGLGVPANVPGIDNLTAAPTP